MVPHADARRRGGDGGGGGAAADEPGADGGLGGRVGGAAWRRCSGHGHESIPRRVDGGAGRAVALPGEADAPADSEEGVDSTGWARLRQRWRVVRSATGASGVVEVLGDQPVLTQLRPPSTSALHRTTSDPQTGLRSVAEVDPQVFATVSGAERSPSPDARVKQMSWLGRSEERVRRLSRSASPSRRASRPSEGKERLLSPRKTPPPSAPPPRSTEDVELETRSSTRS